MLEFDWPYAFLLLPLPLLVIFFIPRAENTSAALLVPFFTRLANSSESQSSNRKSFKIFSLALLCLMWICLVAATAKPQWIGEPVNIPTSGRDLMVAVDFSGSMEQDDMVIDNQRIARIVVVKYVVGEFLKRRKADRVGLILFGDQAFLQAPLTFDKTTVNQLLQDATLGIAGSKTAIGDAIGLSIKRLRDRPESQRVLILLTDGANTAGEVSPRQAADLAKSAGVKIYTVGVGADSLTVSGLLGMPRRINPSSDLDEDALQYIADTTGGKYFRARDPQELVSIYEELDRLEPIEQEAETYRPTQALFYWPTLAAIIIAMLLGLIKYLQKRGVHLSDSFSNSPIPNNSIPNNSIPNNQGAQNG